MADDVEKNEMNNIESEEEKKEREEYEAALEKLGKSKGERIKEITDEKKAKKQEARLKKEKELAEQIDADAAQGKKESFFSKCKRDPVIPASILLIILAAVLVTFYYVLPQVTVKSLGLTIDQLRSQYASTTIYTETLANFSFGIPSVTYTEATDSSSSSWITASTDSSSSSDSRLSYFSASIPNTATSFGTAIQGSVRNTDNEITALRVMAEYSSEDEYYDFLVLYIASYLEALFPELSDTDAAQLAIDAIANVSSDDYIVKDDIAYKVSIVKDDTVSYIAFDVMPAGNL